MARAKQAAGQAQETFEENPVKRRLHTLLSYDYRRIAYDVASSIHADLSRMVWTDGKRFYYGTGNPDMPIADEKIEKLHEIQHKLPNPIYRGELTFYPITRQIEYGGIRLKAQVLDTHYISFFADILSGTLGIYHRKHDNTYELWRRYGNTVEQVEHVETFYGVRKPVAGVWQIFMDMVTLFGSDIAPKHVTSGVAIGTELYSGIGTETLDDNTIPKQIVPKTNIDYKKAEEFFKLLCPEHDSRHNLLLATVYPYYKMSNEHFFILKGVGGTGKTRYMEHFAALLGSGTLQAGGAKYAPISLEMLASRSGFESNNAAMNIQGKLVLHSPEVKMSMGTQYLAELKKIATADWIMGRKIGNDQTMFKPYGTLFIDTNENINIKNDEAFERRRVGVLFNEVRPTKSQFAPYYFWVSTLEGACSIFAYAYHYFQDECGGKFSFNNVELEPIVFSNEIREFIAEFMELVNEVGYEKAFIANGKLGAIANFEKTNMFRFYGLKTAVKRIEDKVIRGIKVDDAGKFSYHMAKAGY